MCVANQAVSIIQRYAQVERPPQAWGSLECHTYLDRINLKRRRIMCIDPRIYMNGRA
jgi:hypothetical protein